MNHHIGYHNPERMGYEWGELRDPNDPHFRFLTNRAVGDIEGDVLWVVTSDKGADRRKTYRLCAWFVVDRIEENDEGEFQYSVIGKEAPSLGTRLDRWLALNHYDWFRPFRERQGNFGLGVNPIQKQDLYCLIELLRLEGIPAPR